MNQSFDKILDAIRSKTENTLEEAKAAAHEKGKAKYNKMLEEAQEKIAITRQTSLKNNTQLYEIERYKLKKQLYKKIDDFKQQCVDNVLMDSKASFDTLPSERVVALIKEFLSNFEKETNPRILCALKDFDCVKNEFGNNYQVISDQTINAGFILSFENFDVDMVFDHLFHYRKDYLEKIARETLFEGVDNSWNI